MGAQYTAKRLRGHGGFLCLDVAITECLWKKKIVCIFIAIGIIQVPIRQILCYHRAPELGVRCIFSQSFVWQVVG